jgi:hypothetical protein
MGRISFSLIPDLIPTIQSIESNSWSVVGDGGTGKTTFVKVRLIFQIFFINVVIDDLISQRHLTGEFEKKYIGTCKLLRDSKQRFSCDTTGVSAPSRGRGLSSQVHY